MNTHLNPSQAELKEQEIFDSLRAALNEPVALPEALSILNSALASIETHKKEELLRKEKERELIEKAMSEPWDNQSWAEQRG